MMLEIGVVIFEAAACFGAGAASLRALGVRDDLRPTELWTWSFAVGFGIMGWVLFFLGLAGGYTTVPLTLVLGVACVGLVYLRPLPKPSFRGPKIVEYSLLLLLAAVLLCHILQALAPPADADTLAYHFALPKQFLQLGRLDFVPRAVDGAVPLLIQMTYIPALGLGGERALTLWTMIGGWMMAALVYSFVRRFLDWRWSLAVALIFLTTPATTYGAGSGQIEVRAALFAFLGVVALADGWRTGNKGYIALVGILSGFYAASKYLGLMFLLVVSCVVAIGKQRLANMVIFGLMALIAGFQWYFWNWINTGDPIYPFLIGRFGIGDATIWPPDFYDWFVRGLFDSERAVPTNLFWFLVYPIQATFAGFRVFESGRTGLGVFAILMAPFVLAFMWTRRRRFPSYPVLPAVLVVIGFYTVWFFTGSSQRIRHLLPIYPVLLALFAIAAYRISELWRTRHILAVAFAGILSIQLAGLAVFTRPYIQFALSAETRDAFLERAVGGYSAIQWINRELTPNDRLLTFERQLIYLVDVPVHYGHIYDDPAVDLRPNTPPEKTLRQLRSLGITHWLVGAHGEGLPIFQQADCFTLLHDFETQSFESRTLGLSPVVHVLSLYRFNPTCVRGVG